MSDVRINGWLSIPEGDIEVSFACSGGPGGQNVNKVATKVTLSWDLVQSTLISEVQRARLLKQIPGSYVTQDGVLKVSSSKERDQIRNRRDAEEKLATLVRNGLKIPKVRKKTRPTRASKERRLKHKKQRGQIKQLRKRPKHD